MSSEWGLRYRREGDEQGILDCLTAAFGRWPAVDIDVPPIEHLRWKLGDPMGEQFSYVAESNDGRIIGCQLIFTQHMKYGDRVLVVDNGTDYAVHPDFQGRGLSKEIWNFDYDRFHEHFFAIISISDSPVVLHQVKTIGSGRQLANRMEWLECASIAAPSTTAGIRTVDVFDERADAFCAAALEPFELAIVRTSAYLNWRYADHRSGRHTVRIAEAGGAIVGYAVYGTSRGKGFIADLLVLPGRLDLVAAFVSDARSYFGEQGIEAVRCWSPRKHLYRDSLLGAGFEVLRPVGQFGFGLRGRELPPRDDPNATVHFTVGDTDIV